jgi:uncharacterized membrane protein YtjA (UPF0391 family)
LSPDVATGDPIQQDQIIESNKHREAGPRSAIQAPLAGRSPRNQRHRPPLDQHRAGVAPRRLEERAMTLLKWALIFLLVSVVAGVFGFTGISAASADVARFLFYVFVAIFLVLLVLGLTIFRV